MIIMSILKLFPARWDAAKTMMMLIMMTMMMNEHHTPLEAYNINVFLIVSVPVFHAVPVFYKGLKRIEVTYPLVLPSFLIIFTMSPTNINF